MIIGGLDITQIPHRAIMETIVTTIPHDSLRKMHPNMLTVITDAENIVLASDTSINWMDQINKNVSKICNEDRT